MSDVDFLYSYGKLGMALDRLAVHPGEIKTRLLAAAEYLVAVNASSMPSDETQVSKVSVSVTIATPLTSGL